MTPFITNAGIAAPLPLANVDTDKILPAVYIKTISRQGLGQALFASMRGPDFILDTAPWNKANTLIALENFGCGSSREHAPWALLDFGIRCIIAPSYADIFYNNCFKNGILPITLPREDVVALVDRAGDPAHAWVEVDLEAQTVRLDDGLTLEFEIDPARKHILLTGADDISRTLAVEAEITRFEKRQAERSLIPPIPLDVASL